MRFEIPIVAPAGATFDGMPFEVGTDVPFAFGDRMITARIVGVRLSEDKRTAQLRFEVPPDDTGRAAD